MKSCQIEVLLGLLLLSLSAGYASAQDTPQLTPLNAIKLEVVHYKKPTPAERELLDKLYSIVVEFESAKVKNESAWIASGGDGIKLLLARSDAALNKANYERKMVQKLDAAGLAKMAADDLPNYRAKHLELEVKVAERAKSQAQNERKLDIQVLLRQAEIEKDKWEKAVKKLTDASPAEAAALLEKDQKEARKIVERVYAELSKR